MKIFQIMNQSSSQPLRKPRSIKTSLLLFLSLMIVLTGCRSNLETAPTPEATQDGQISFSGEGPGKIQLSTWDGPAVLHLTALDGSAPFHVVATSGLDFHDLIESESSVDEYRGIIVDSSSKMEIRIEGDRTWKVEVLPVQTASFDVLQVPGTYSGQGNRVILLEGKHSVATFDTGSSTKFDAWALGESQKWEHLKITSKGDYKGKSVLPNQTRVIIVSASGPWSVLIPEPCCEKLW